MKNSLLKLLIIPIFALSVFASCQQLSTKSQATSSNENFAVPFDQLDKFGLNFYLVNLHQEDFGFDMITRIYPDTSRMAKYAMIEGIQKNDTLKIRILYSIYRVAKHFKQRSREQFEALIFRMTREAALATQLSHGVFDSLVIYDALPESEKAKWDLLYPAYLGNNKYEKPLIEQERRYYHSAQKKPKVEPSMSDSSSVDSTTIIN